MRSMSVSIVAGENLKRLAMLRHQTAADVAYVLADASSRDLSK